jgi:hypothetical protein
MFGWNKNAARAGPDIALAAPAGQDAPKQYTTVGKLARYKAHKEDLTPKQAHSENTMRTKARALYKVIEHILTSDPEDLVFGRPYNDSDTLGLLWDTGYEIILSYDHTFRNKTGTVLYNEPCILVRPSFHAFWGFIPAEMNNENEIIMRKLHEKYEGSIIYKWDDLQRYDGSCLNMDATDNRLYAGDGLTQKDYDLRQTYPLTDRLIIPFPK